MEDAASPGLTSERSGDGVVVTLRPAGLGRYFTAAFLALWLSFWVFGEAFAGWFLLAGAYSVVTGGPLMGTTDALALVPALAVGAFLLLWLCLWTLGGYMAAREFLRSVTAEDRIVLGGEGLTVHRRIGPFRSTTVIPRSDLLRVYSIPRKQRVMAETSSGAVELTSHPLVRNAVALAELLRTEAKIDPQAASRSLPEHWTEVADPAGGVSLVRNLQHRPAQARTAWIVTAVVALFAMPVVESASLSSERAAAAKLLAAFTAWLAWGSWRLSSSRLEWKLEQRRVRYRRRWARRTEVIFEGNCIELVETTDSDGDAWFKLMAVTSAPRSFDWRRPLSSWRRRWTIDSDMDDATNVRRVAQVVAARTGLRLEERKES